MTRLRRAAASDLAMLRRWRNAPSSRRWFRSTGAVTAAEHARWLAATLADRRRLLWIVEDGKAAAGQVRLDLRGATAEISVTIAPGSRGRGLGSAALELAARAARRRGLKRLDAVVLEANAASAGAFLKAGFRFQKRVRAEGRPAYLLTRSL